MVRFFSLSFLCFPFALTESKTLWQWRNEKQDQVIANMHCAPRWLRISEWMTEWITELMYEWMNEWITHHVIWGEIKTWGILGYLGMLGYCSGIAWVLLGYCSGIARVFLGYAWVCSGIARVLISHFSITDYQLLHRPFAMQVSRE